MISTILGAFRVGEIRNKVLFTALVLALYRLGTHIPAPGINSSAVNAIQKNFGGSNILGLLNLFSGGGLGRIAIFALGIMPYITASIILQLLTVVVPSLEKLQKDLNDIQAKLQDPKTTPAMGADLQADGQRKQRVARRCRAVRLAGDQHQPPQRHRHGGPPITAACPYRIWRDDKHPQQDNAGERDANYAARDQDESFDRQRRRVIRMAKAAEHAAHRPLARR